MKGPNKLDNFSFVHELAYQLKVRDAMASSVTTVTPENSMREVRNILRDKRISGLPVVDGKKLVGIISVEDIINALDEKDIDSKVAQRMTRNVKTLDPNYTLIKALQIFQSYPYGRFPVVDKNKNLLGIMTSTDITRRLLLELNAVADEAAAKEALQIAHKHVFGADQDKFLLEGNLRAGDFENAGILSSKLRNRLHDMGVIPEIIRRASIATYEVETNIIIHSVGGTLKVYMKQGKLVLEAKDRGPGIPDMGLAMKPGYSTATDQIRALGFGAGMGLPNVKRCADHFHIESQVGKGTSVTVEIEFKTANVLAEKV